VIAELSLIFINSRAIGTEENPKRHCKNTKFLLGKTDRYFKLAFMHTSLVCHRISVVEMAQSLSQTHHPKSQEIEGEINLGVNMQ
jgi:hypothetical protein